MSLSSFSELSSVCFDTSPSISGADASAWNVRELPDGSWRWVAFSDWTRAGKGCSPEVDGIAESQAQAKQSAIAAARSMNPHRWVEISASSPAAWRQAG